MNLSIYGTIRVYTSIEITKDETNIRMNTTMILIMFMNI